METNTETSFIDAHCHLGNRQFEANLDNVLARMKQSRVTQAIMICCSQHDMENGIRLRNDNAGFKLAIGIHPQGIEHYDDDWLNNFDKYIKYSNPDMIGEIGLDYQSHRHTRDLQKQHFHAQLALASEYHLPVDIHCRNGSQDTYDILRQYPVKGIIHSYSGSVEMAQLFMKLGYYISFGASILFENARRPKEVLASIPLNRLLLETDAPYQSPIRNHVHEPADVVAIYREASLLQNVSLKHLSDILQENFSNVFSR